MKVAADVMKLFQAQADLLTTRGAAFDRVAAKRDRIRRRMSAHARGTAAFVARSILRQIGEGCPRSS